MRTYETRMGEICTRTDEEMVEAFLTGYIDPYSGGALEQLQAEVRNLRARTAEALLLIGREPLVKHCEGRYDD